MHAVDRAPVATRELPMAGQRRERGDAAANRVRILAAARKLLIDHGPDALSMDAVAAAAGVGKGTIFRRFGDRAGLTQALLDDYMQGLQEAFLFGPPPLGPGAPAAERIEAFVLEIIRSQDESLVLALAAEGRPGQPPNAGYGSMLLHLRALLHEIDPALDSEVLGALILGAVAPPIVHRLRQERGGDIQALEAAALALLRGAATGRA